MVQGKVCIMCGCEVGEGDPVCPICGTALAPATGHDAQSPSGPEHWGASGNGKHAKKHRNASRLRHVKAGKLGSSVTIAGRQIPRGAMAIAAVALGLIVVIVIALIVRSLIMQHEFNQRVEEAAGSSAAASATNGNRKAGFAGNVSAGGICAEADGGVLVASSEGVFLVGDKSLDGALQKKASQGAWDVCRSDSTLFFLEPSGQWGAPFEGASIQTIAEIDEDGQKTPQELHAKSAYSCLTCEGGFLFYLKRDGRSYGVIKEAAVGASSDAPAANSDTVSVLGEFDAQKAWLFVQGDIVYVVKTEESAWEVRQIDLSSDDGQGFDNASVVARGKGMISTACINNGALYYSLAADGSRLQRSDLKGGMTEYADVVDAVVAAGSGDYVAVLTKAGNLTWVDAVTGVSHDLTGELERLLPDVSPSKLAMSVSGSWVYLADGKGNLVRIGMNGAAGEVLESS